MSSSKCLRISGIVLVGASEASPPKNISVATSTKVTVQIAKHSSIDTILSARLRFSGMEMLDVDNWDNDFEFSRFADSPKAMEGGEKVLHCLALKKAFAHEKEYDLILSDVDLGQTE
jgi:hypothetical protein